MGAKNDTSHAQAQEPKQRNCFAGSICMYYEGRLHGMPPKGYLSPLDTALFSTHSSSIVLKYVYALGSMLNL